MAYLGGGAHSVSGFLKAGNPVSSCAGGLLCKAVIVLALRANRNMFEGQYTVTFDYILCY